MTDSGTTPEIVNRLLLLRLRNGLTTQKMAEICGLPKSSLESYMKVIGAKRPGLDALMAIAEGMDVSIDWLVGRTEDSFSPKLNQREYALACFNAALRLLRFLREFEEANPGPLFTAETAAGKQDYHIAANAMLDFMEAVRLYQNSGKNPDRQSFANEAIDTLLRETGN